MLLGALIAAQAHAQSSQNPSLSPFAPGDLKAPIFDTQTPRYDTAAAGTNDAKTVVAEVDGRPITLGDVGYAITELPPGVKSLPFVELFPSVVTQLVRQQALVMRAQQQGLDEDPVTRRKVKAATDRVLANEFLQHEITSTITEDALLARYQADVASKPGPDEVHLRVIVMQTKDAAQGIISELQAGADFAALARRSSTDSTASVAGDLGFVRMDGLNAEVGSVAFSMQPGKFTPYPFRSTGGWFIVKVEERRTGPIPHFAEARAGLVQAILRESVGDIVSRALKDVTVREYSINGTEVDSEAAK